MSNWIALKALAAGGAAWMGKRDEDKKRELALKLEQDREERAEQREIAREQRAEKRKLQEVAETEIVDKDGIKFEVGLNSRRQPISERLANPDRIAQIEFEKKKRDAELNNLVLGGDLLGLKVDEAEADLADKPLATRLARARELAQIGAAERSNRPDPAKKVDTSVGGLTNLLMTQSEDLVKEYTTAPEGSDPQLTATEFRYVVQNVIKEAAKSKQDARVLLPKALELYAKRKAQGN